MVKLAPRLARIQVFDLKLNLERALKRNTLINFVIPTPRYCEYHRSPGAQILEDV